MKILQAPNQHIDYKKLEIAISSLDARDRDVVLKAIETLVDACRDLSENLRLMNDAGEQLIESQRELLAVLDSLKQENEMLKMSVGMKTTNSKDVM